VEGHCLTSRLFLALSRVCTGLHRLPFNNIIKIIICQ
jgi:hypothetical protein